MALVLLSSLHSSPQISGHLCTDYVFIFFFSEISFGNNPGSTGILADMFCTQWEPLQSGGLRSFLVLLIPWKCSQIKYPILHVVNHGNCTLYLEDVVHMMNETTMIPYDQVSQQDWPLVLGTPLSD